MKLLLFYFFIANFLKDYVNRDIKIIILEKDFEILI